MNQPSVRGHEEVPGFGHLRSPLVARKVPTPTEASAREVPWSETVVVLTNDRNGPRGLLHEISEGTHGHACRLSRGGLLSGRRRDLRNDPEDGPAIGRGSTQRRGRNR